MNAAQLTIAEAARLIKRQKLSPVELVQDVFRRIDLLEPTFHTYITLMKDAALGQARQAERDILAGNYMGPMHGIPVSIKDIAFTKGVRTTAGTSVLSDFVPTYDATVVTKLKEAGAIILGKNNMHEFALGTTNVNPYYGTVPNPWSQDRIPGGSSGGSAVAVATCMAMGAIGGDGGASIRMPAAFNNIVGIKPTNGLISRYGAFIGTWTLDSSGPMTRTVEDNALMLQAVAGHDPLDPYSAKVPVPNYLRAMKKGNISELRIGVPKEYYFEISAKEVADAVKKAIGVLANMGANVVEVSLPNAKYAVDAGAVISWSEYAVSQEELIRKNRDEFGADVMAILDLASMHMATHYIKAQRARAVMIEEYNRAFQQVDVIITPTCPIPPPRIGEDTMLQVALLTRIACMTGEPALSVPCGFTTDGLPIGAHIQAKRFNEAVAFRVGHAYEQATDWHLRRPPVAW